MSRKIKLHSLHFLFQIFSFLADKTGGWKLFVKPKLIIGSLILGLGITACNTKTSHQNSSTQSNDRIETQTQSIESDSITTSDSTSKTNSNKKSTIFHKNIPSKHPKKKKEDSTITLSSPKANSQQFTQIDSIIGCYVIVEPHINPLDSNSIYEVVEQMPEYPGGIDSLFKYINSELRYPNNEVDVQGRVICRFVVEKDGSLNQINVVRSLEKSYDKEVVRLIQNMPKWIPGKQNGKNVSVWFTLPINFKFE